jgi:hypothetical protein
MLKGSGHPPIDKICAYCKKHFIVRYKFRDAKCCSLKCASLYGWTTNRVTFKKPCEICGRLMETRPSRIRAGRGKYCSKECYTIGQVGVHTGRKFSEESREKIRQSKIGEKNPAYIHGHNHNHIRYMAGFTTTLRKRIKERDNYTCQKCGNRERLQIHHLDHDPLHNDPKNLTTWCIHCHMIHHRGHPDRMWGEMPK